MQCDLNAMGYLAVQQYVVRVVISEVNAMR